LIGAAVIGLMLARASPAQEAGVIRLAYLGFLGAAEVVRMDIDLDLGPDLRRPERYHMTMRLGTTGGLEKLVPFVMDADAQGRAGSGGIRPARFFSNTRLLKNNQAVTLDYNGDGTVEITTEPPTVEARQAEREGWARSTLDPLSATLAIINSVIQTGDCAVRIPVFDGTRRYDLNVTPAGRSQVTRLGFSLYEGEATECTAKTQLIAGFRQADVDAKLYPETTTFWLAPVLDNTSSVLVRVATRTALGALRLDLIEAKLLPAGTQ
jgi:hypothetical protein